MAYGELYLPQVPTGRNAKTGRFVKVSEYLQRWCDENNGNGPWRQEVSYVHPMDVFNMNIIAYNYRPFDTKYIFYTGRIGLVGAPRYNTTKHLLLGEQSNWRYGTERLLWFLEDKTQDFLMECASKAMKHMVEDKFDRMWICHFNTFRVASGMFCVEGREVPMFGDLARKMGDYDPYAQKFSFRLVGEEWERTLDVIGNTEIPCDSELTVFSLP